MLFIISIVCTFFLPLISETRKKMANVFDVWYSTWCLKKTFPGHLTSDDITRNILGVTPIFGIPQFSLVINTYVPIASPTASKIGGSGGGGVILILQFAVFPKLTSCQLKCGHHHLRLEPSLHLEGLIIISMLIKWRWNTFLQKYNQSLLKWKLGPSTRIKPMVTSKKEWIEWWNWCSYWV